MKLLIATLILTSSFAASASEGRGHVWLFEACVSRNVKESMTIVKDTVGLRQLSQVEAAGELAILVCKEQYARLGRPVSDADSKSEAVSQAILDGVFAVYPELKEKIKLNN